MAPKRARSFLASESSTPSTSEHVDSDVPVKRRRVSVENFHSLNQDQVPTSSSHERLVHVSRKLHHIGISQLTTPKSLYSGWAPPLAISSEIFAIEKLSVEFHVRQWDMNFSLIDWQQLYAKNSPMVSEDKNDLGYTSFNISEFTLYKPTYRRAREGWDSYSGDHEMAPLHSLRTKRGCDELVMDGIIAFRGERFFLRAVPFSILAINGYGDIDCHSVAKSIWIQSPQAAANNVWYRLTTPSSEYLRYHTAFLWVADFGKHFVDFLLEHKLVTFEDFRCHFYKWLISTHGNSAKFRRWLAQYGGTDFRTVITTHFEHLWMEANNISSDARKHPLWKEIDPRGPSAIPLQKSICAKTNMTVVTPFIYDCFKNMYFAPMLENRYVKDPAILAAQLSRKKKLGFTSDSYSALPLLSPPPETIAPKRVQKGDVVGVSRDIKSLWKDEAETWFAYIREIHEDTQGQYLEVTWLYRPEDTTLSNMNYPFRNELFMSDHCNCHDKTFRLSAITSKITVAWYPQSLPLSNYFVRQKYCTEEQSFVTLRPRDFTCDCHDRKPTAFEIVKQQFEVHDTILAVQGQQLEPFVIIDFIQQSEVVQVRQLLRADKWDSNKACPANELLWTDRFLDIKPQCVDRKCHVRFVLQTEKIPTPYNRRGQIDCFFITRRLVHSQSRDVLKDLQMPFPGPITVGFDPTKDVRSPMPAMSLFSGGGNFDRGLEECGAVHTKWAVEWNLHAVHTYKANCKDGTVIFHGSVDEALARAIEGLYSKHVPRIGEVLMIMGGSPCQGFSVMQPNTLSAQSLTNASKVASTCAFIDFYRPGYVILENVVSMTRACGKDKNENVFSQVLCALVGMGYQAQQFNLDAWSFGDAQSRSRLFIIATAPALVPISHPHLTHSHPMRTSARKLGAAINGVAFGKRRFDITPFNFVSAAEATEDLPDIGDGQVGDGQCIPFPDHRQSIFVRPLLRHLINSIPTTPPEMSLVKTALVRKLPQPLLEYLDKQPKLRLTPNSNCWKRVNPNGLFPTIVTKLAPADAKAGHGLHWKQPRVLTVMEARRAQGFLDNEPIIGVPATQWKIIGNSVARSVSLALGMSLREAWLKNSADVVKKITEADVIETQMRKNNDAFHCRPNVMIVPKVGFDKSEYIDWSDEGNGSDGSEVVLVMTTATADVPSSSDTAPREDLITSNSDPLNNVNKAEQHHQYQRSKLGGPGHSRPTIIHHSHANGDYIDDPDEFAGGFYLGDDEDAVISLPIRMTR